MPTTMSRKIIKFGVGSYVISLPISWVRYYELKPGDKLEVITNGKLIIRPVRKR